jgi:calcineurin-like phosphoesterase
MVIANGENAAGGAGITLETASEIFASGVDIITTGDHLWDQREVTELLLKEPRFLRPINYPAGTLGQGSTVWQRQGLASVGVVNAQGRSFMAPLENPFVMVAEEVERLRRMTPIIFVDMHLGEDRDGANAGRPGERRGRHAHPCADRGRTDLPGRHGVLVRRRIHGGA